MKKIGLVIEGGGMKCAYNAGILDRFLDDHIQFPYVIGVSAGCANGASYLAGQRGRNLRFYTEHTKEKGYFGLGSFLKTGDLFGLDYIYSDCTNHDGNDPLDFPAMSKNPAEYCAVATNALTGEPHYFYKKELSQDHYEIIKASCALPAACRPRVIDGVPYYDGGVSDSLPLDHALSDGCDKVVVLTTKPRDYVKQPEKFRLFYSIRCRKYPKIVKLLNERHINYRKSMERMFELEKEGKAFLFQPSEHLEMGTFAMDLKAEQDLYDLAFRDYDTLHDSLLQFMES